MDVATKLYISCVIGVLPIVILALANTCGRLANTIAHLPSSDHVFSGSEEDLSEVVFNEL